MSSPLFLPFWRPPMFPDCNILGREWNFLLPHSTSSKGGCSLSALHRMAAWVFQTSFLLCLDVLCWSMNVFFIVWWMGEINWRAHSAVVLMSFLHYLFIFYWKSGDATSIFFSSNACFNKNKSECPAYLLLTTFIYVSNLFPDLSYSLLFLLAFYD